MNGSWIALLSAAIVALIGAGGVLAARWVDSRAQERAKAYEADLSERTVDREQFDSITRELRASIADLRKELATERDMRAAAELRAVSSEARERALETRVSAAEGRVTQLETAMRAANMIVPPPRT